MKYDRMIRPLVWLVVILTLATNAWAQADYDSVSKLMDSAKALEAPVYAPKAFKQAQSKLDEARKAIDSKKGQQTVDKLVAEANQLGEAAIRATGECKVTLKEYVGARDAARRAKAPDLVPDLYAKADNPFLAATGKVESGDVKGALKEAAKSTPLYNTAESEAIVKGVLTPAQIEVEKATALESEKYAAVTLGRARAAYQKAIDIIAADKSNVAEATKEAALAEYEAKHASQIAQMVKGLNRNDQAYETVISAYETEMNRVGQGLGLTYLPFDNGPSGAADTLNSRIESLKSDGNQRAQQVSDSLAKFSALVTVLARRFDLPAGADPMASLGSVDSAVTALIAQTQQLSQTVAAEQTRLAELSQTHEEAEAELNAYKVASETIEKARGVLNPIEGAVVENAAGDLVVRLKGLQFQTGKSAITEDMVPLLEKVQSILVLFPDNKLMVQGHTDDQGGVETNMALSEKRAIAVKDYFRQAMSLNADRISAAGFGADKPVASNQTPEGRAQNRRIDIVILK